MERWYVETRTPTGLIVRGKPVFSREDAEAAARWSNEQRNGCHSVAKPAEAPPQPLRPIFGFDPDEHERLRRVFEAWDFRTGT